MSIKLLLVERSVYQRIVISKMLSTYKNIDIIDIVKDGKEAIESISKNYPDVIIIDLDMINSIDKVYIQNIINNFSIPIIFLISSEVSEKDLSLKSLISKVFDTIVKPSGLWKEIIPKIKNELITKINLAVKSNIGKTKENIQFDNKKYIRKSKYNKEIIRNLNIEKLDHPRHEEYFFDRSPINIKELATNAIVMGASVGGPRTIKAIIEKIPKDFPSPILIVQHMNHFFMRQFAVNLMEKSQITIKIGKNGEFIQPGIVYLAQGDKHMQIVERGGKPCIRIFDGEPVNYCRPSVDVLFFSAARIYKKDLVGILLTGMGVDGVAGLKAIKELGGKTITESEETAVLYGMPKAAAESGVSDYVVPNYLIPNYMVRFAKKLS